VNADDERRFGALAEKYERLLALRRERDRGTAPPDRSVFRALAARFPGCLRELELLPLDELEQRASACRRAERGGAPPDWARWMHEFHALLRCAHELRGQRGRKRHRDDASSTRGRAADLAGRHDVDVDDAVLERLLDPPDGRTVDVALSVIATRHGADLDLIGAMLAPSSRRVPPAGARAAQGPPAQSPSFGTSAGTSAPEEAS
jgi:hypothetical protein